jgi:hypothetical protein
MNQSTPKISGFQLWRRQDGVASLVGVSLTAFLLLVLTIAIATLMNGELQRATDTADNIEAYNNAQSSGEEATLNIKDILNTASPASSLETLLNQGCGSSNANPNDIIPEALPTGSVTCQSVATNSADVQDDLDNNQDVQFDLTNAPNLSINTLSLQWDMKYPPTPPNPSAFFSPLMSDLTQAENAWESSEGNTNHNVPPVMEVTVTNYFPGQQTNVDQSPGCGGGYGSCSSGSVILLPQWQCGSTGCTASTDFQNAAQDKNGSTPVIDSNCQDASSGGYRCQMTLTDITPQPGYKTVLRLESRFGDASYDLKAYEGANQVQLPLQNAQVDITSNVGQSFRRVQLDVPIRSSVYPDINVLYGDQSLCKDFDVLNDGAGHLTPRQHPGSTCPL